MTDFASLLTADRGQSARAIHLVDKEGFDGWLKSRPAEDRACSKRSGSTARPSFAFALLPRGGEFEVVSAVKNAAALSPWCLARLAESLPEGTYRLAAASPARRRSAGCSASTGSTPIAPGRTSRSAGRACLSPARRRGSMRPCGSPKRPRWSATWSTRPPATSAPPSSSKRCATIAEALGAQVRVTVGRRARRRLSADRRGRRAAARRAARRA